MWTNTLLLDRKTPVASDQLVSNMLKAALLAHERSGAIRLVLDDDPDLRESTALIVAPTGTTHEWPAATLEARLFVSRRASVSDIVFDWLGEASPDPWSRAAEQGKIMLVLRGIADVSLGSWGGRRYALNKDASALISQTSAQPVLDALADCRHNRPEIWQALDHAINDAFQRRDSADKHADSSRSDPWLAESVEDQKRNAVHQAAKRIPLAATLAIGIGLACFDWWFATRNGLGAVASITAGILATTYGLLVLQQQRLKRLEKAFSNWVAGRMPFPIKLPDRSADLWKARLEGFVVGVPALTGVVLLAIAHPDRGLVVLLGGWGAYSLYGLLRRMLAKKAAVAISARVSGHPPGPAGTTTAPAADPAPVSTPSASPKSLQIALELVTAEALPVVSEQSRQRLAAVDHRGPSVRRAYRKAILGLAGSTVLLATVYWLIGPSPLDFTAPSTAQDWRMPDRLPWFLLSAFVITLVMLSPRGAAWVRGAAVSMLLSVMTGARVSTSKAGIDETAAIRPIALPVLGGLWVIVALLLTLFRYASLKPSEGLLFTCASWAIILGYLYWIRRTTKAIEVKHPYQAPFNLLGLRVFGSPHLSDFMDLTNAWQWLGTRQMLDGPDTVGHKTRDLINYFSGRLADSIVENEAELRDALSEFKTTPDLQLRFPVNSMQCSDASWKGALQSLLDAADVIVMDLSSLSEKNRGIAYELGRVFDQVELKRIVLLADDSTDFDLLQNVLAGVWENMTPASPNRHIAEGVLRVYHLGGSLRRLPGESLYDWKRRMKTQIDEKHLVCLLYDSAQPRRTPVTVDPKRDAQSIRWSRVPMPNWVRSLRNYAFGSLLVLLLVISGCQVMVGR